MDDYILKSANSKGSQKSPPRKSVPMNILLKELPVYNEENFSKFKSDSYRQFSKKSINYIPTNDDYPSIEIVSEKNNILLRYLHQSWEKKCPRRKRENPDKSSAADDESANQNTGQPKAKRSRTENISQDNGSSTNSGEGAPNASRQSSSSNS